MAASSSSCKNNNNNSSNNSSSNNSDCVACKHGHNSTPIKIHYFYVDKDLGAKKIVCKSSSTSQVKQDAPFCRNPCGSSSDSNLADFDSCSFTPTTASICKESKVNIRELEKDLSAIREQLYILTKNKNIALSVTNELHGRYKYLLRKNEEQQKIIEKLRRQVTVLCKKKSDSTNTEFMCDLKQTLGKCEEKLGIIFEECVRKKSQSNCTDTNRDKITQSLTDQVNFLQGQLQQNQIAKEKLEKDLEHARCEKCHLEEACMNLKDELEHSDKKLSEMDSFVVDLNNQLCHFAQQRREHEETKKMVQNLREELDYKNQECQQLDLECKKLREKLEALNCKNVQLNNGICDLQNRIAEFQRISRENETKQQICQTLCKQLEGKVKCYEERDAKRLKELQVVKAHNAALVMEMQRMKNFAEDVEHSDLQIDLEKASCHCSTLPSSVQILINAIYAALVKIHECEKNLKLLRKLMSALNVRDKELSEAKNEIEVLRNDLQAATADNDHLAMNLMFLQGGAKANYIEYIEETVQVECSCDTCHEI